MTPNDLRIGNYINVQGQEQRLNIGLLETYLNTPSGFSAIRLNKAWLEKFGFKEMFTSKGMFWHLKAEIFDLSLNQDEAIINATGRFNGAIENFKIELRYVHELQNLFFAITAKEII